MDKRVFRSALLAACMCASLVVATVLTPRVRMIRNGSGHSLESTFPKKFGDWVTDDSIRPIAVDPRVRETLNTIYSDTLERSYVNSRGQRVMLSVAYGADQGRTNQVHKPEVCYPAQGFSIKSMQKSSVRILGGEVPVMRMLAIAGQRIEPVTYWIVVGDTIVRGSLEQNAARLKYGIRGVVADGLLFRVSTVQTSEEEAYKIQDDFVNNLMDAVPVAERKRFLGFSAQS